MKRLSKSQEECDFDEELEGSYKVYYKEEGVAFPSLGHDEYVCPW